MVENLYASFINLDHRTDRRAHMERELTKSAILKAVRTRGTPWQEAQADPAKVAVMLNRTPGAIGCHFSQVAVMKEGQRQGKNALVMEDDIIFCEDIDKRLTYIDKWTETHEWDVIWLGASFHAPVPYWHKKGESGMPPDCSAQLGYDVQVTDDPRMIRTFGAYVTFAYIVNLNSMDKIFALFEEHLHTSIGIDWLFIKLQPQLKCFSFVPGCVMQGDWMSDIGNGMTVWSGQLNNGPYVWKNKMEEFEPTTFTWN